MKRVAERAQRPLTQLAIRWVLQQPDIASAIVSAKTPDQLEQNAAALDGEIADEVFAALTAISDEAMTAHPQYRQYVSLLSVRIA